MFLIILLNAFFASSIVASKQLLLYTKPVFLTGIRMLIAGLLLLAYQYFHPHQEFKFHKEHIWYYIRLVLFGVYFAYILRFWSLGYMPAFKLIFIHNLSPFLTALYSYFMFKDKMRIKQWCGLGIGLAGMIPILLTTTTAETKMGELFFISWPEIAVLFSVGFMSYNWVLMKAMINEHRYSPMMVNGISMTSGGLLALVTSPIVEGMLPVTNWAPFLVILAFVIIVSNLICHNLYGHLLRHYSATLLSFAGFTAPCFTALYEWALYGTVITWHFYASSIIVFIGLFLFYQDELYIKARTKTELELEETAIDTEM